MSDVLWIAALIAVLAVGYYGMGKLGDFMDRNRTRRQDLSRMRHKG